MSLSNGIGNGRVTAAGGTARAQRSTAALHEAGDRWHVVVVQRQPARLLEARTLATGAVKELEEMIRRLRVERLVRLVPGAQTIARCVSIPTAEPSEAAAALALIAEAELPDSIPPHRRAAGVIPEIARAGVQTGLLTGWPIAQGGEPSPVASRELPESWGAEIAALAALRGDGGLAVYADARAGSISLLAGGPTRTVARVLMEDNSTPQAWSDSVQRAIAETCRIAGVEGEPPLPPHGALLLTEPAREALLALSGGKSRDAGWLEEFGLALGAAMLAVSEQPAQRALTELTASAPRERRDIAERGLAWLSVRRNAWKAAAASVAALFLLPLGIAWARMAVLESKVAALHAQEGSREELARSAAMYEQLRRTRWPMTKLLADVSGALPLGVRVETVRLSSDQGLGLEATAESADAVSTLQQNLNRSGIFRDVQISRRESAAGGAVTFEIAAAIASPFLSAAPAEDFAAQPLAVRLYGEGATNTSWNAEGDKTTASRPGRAERPSKPEGGAKPEDKGAADGPASPSRPSGSGSAELPEALTDDQIKAMDFNASMHAWAARKNALSTRKDLDQTTKDRLASEVDKLKAQMDAKKAK